MLQNKFNKRIIFKVFACHFQDPDGEIENSGKSIFEIRIPNFCYIQVVKNIKSVFKKDSDFKNSFPGVFNFTVGILLISQHIGCEHFHFAQKRLKNWLAEKWHLTFKVMLSLALSMIVKNFQLHATPRAPRYWRKVCWRNSAVQLKIPGKPFSKIRIPNFCYIQVKVFDLS